jgi:hypothetical protein
MALLSVVLFVISGCAAKVHMYPGAELTPDKYATVRAEPKISGFFDHADLSIMRVDCDLTMGILGTVFRDGHWAQEVYVLPGKRRLQLHWSRGFFLAGGRVWFVGEAGKRYLARAESKGGRVRMWIEDERTGEPVGGWMGSDDEPKGEECSRISWPELESPGRTTLEGGKR